MSRLLIFALVVFTPGSTLWSQDACWSGTADMVGARGADRVIQKSLNGLRVCALARDLAYAQHLPPGEWPATSSAVVLETQLAGAVHRMRFAAGAATFESNGAARPIDSAATQWRAALMDALTATWQLDRLPGRDSAGHVQVAMTLDEVGSPQGIATAVPSELGAISSELARLKAEWQRVYREINTLQAEVSRLQRDLRNEQSSIGQLQSQLATADARERARINRDIQRGQQEVARISSAIRQADMNAQSRAGQLAAQGIPKRVEKLERQLREVAGTLSAADDDQKTKHVSVENQFAAADRLLAAEHARNKRTLEASVEQALARLRAAISALASP